MLQTILNTRLLLIAIIAGALGLAGCGDSAADDAPGPTVVAGTTQVADLARNVAGKRADVVGILAPNSDPHEYEPRPSDAESLGEAEVVLKSGGDVDLWLDELVESSGSEATVVELIDAVETIPGREGDGDEPDPHWWQSPVAAAAAVEAIEGALTEADPEGRSDYERNATEYLARLRALDREVGRCLGRVPADERKLVTSHDSLGYFADRYGVEIVGSTIPALTTQAQPSAGETAELVELIESEGVAAVFPEAGGSDSLEQAVAAETGAEVGAELYADTLGPPGSAGETYIGAAAANADAIATGLGAGGCELTAAGG